MSMVTVFTPTYNRKYIIGELYESLKKQTNQNFEWLVIDDGSTDQTNILVQSWINENKICIRYFYINNGGKQHAINYALEKAEGDLFIVVDSDDYLSDDAIEKIILWEKEVPKEKFCGFSGNMATKKGKILNPIFDQKYIDCTMLDRYPRKENNFFFIGYDRAWIFFTEVHRKYLYPILENERFISEAVTWNRMANDGYKIRCFNDIIYYFEHQEDGLTNNILSLYLENPYSYALWKIELEKFLTKSLMKKLFMRYSLFCDLKIKYNLKQISKYTKTFICIIILFELIHRLKNIKK